MNYKVKSLLFFIAFVLSSLIYYTVDQLSYSELENTNTEIADIEAEDDIPANEDNNASFVE